MFGGDSFPEVEGAGRRNGCQAAGFGWLEAPCFGTEEDVVFGLDGQIPFRVGGEPVGLAFFQGASFEVFFSEPFAEVGDIALRYADDGKVFIRFIAGFFPCGSIGNPFVF